MKLKETLELAKQVEALLDQRHAIVEHLYKCEDLLRSNNIPIPDWILK